jgi:hypothetical protein
MCFSFPDNLAGFCAGAVVGSDFSVAFIFISSASGVVTPAVGISSNIVIAAAPDEGIVECAKEEWACFYLSPTIRKMGRLGD